VSNIEKALTDHAVYDINRKADALTSLVREAPLGTEIMEQCLDIAELLLSKNISYGNSAIEPVRFLSKASAEEQILVRIDDKLNRLRNQQSYPGEDTITDLVGYLVLLQVLRKKAIKDAGLENGL
jgi:hypothetical protein